MIKNEKEFQRELGRLVKEQGRRISKRPDVGRETKPYDCDIRTENVDISLELKIVPTAKTNALRKVLPHQRGNLEMKAKLGARCLIAWYIQENGSVGVYGVSTKTTVIVGTIGDFVSLIGMLGLES